MLRKIKEDIETGPFGNDVVLKKGSVVEVTGFTGDKASIRYQGFSYLVKRDCLELDKIQSFVIDHNKLEPGIYVSRLDDLGNVKITTFDLRFKRPYKEGVMTTGTMHAIEHLAATWFRNNRDDVVYFGPMGCRTGFYLILSQELEPEDILDDIKTCCDYILDFNGVIPGCSEVECGNCYDMDLDQAKIDVAKYLYELRSRRFKYPE